MSSIAGKLRSGIECESKVFKGGFDRGRACSRRESFS